MIKPISVYLRIAAGNILRFDEEIRALHIFFIVLYIPG